MSPRVKPHLFKITQFAQDRGLQLCLCQILHIDPNQKIDEMKETTMWPMFLGGWGASQCIAHEGAWPLGSLGVLGEQLVHENELKEKN